MSERLGLKLETIACSREELPLFERRDTALKGLFAGLLLRLARAQRHQREHQGIRPRAHADAVRRAKLGGAAVLFELIGCIACLFLVSTRTRQIFWSLFDLVVPQSLLAWQRVRVRRTNRASSRSAASRSACCFVARC